MDQQETAAPQHPPASLKPLGPLGPLGPLPSAPPRARIPAPEPERQELAPLLAPRSSDGLTVITLPAGPPSRTDVTGRSRRDYPPLRGALIKLAHDDPATAARLIAALLPVQSALLTAEPWWPASMTASPPSAG